MRYWILVLLIFSSIKSFSNCVINWRDFNTKTISLNSKVHRVEMKFSRNIINSECEKFELISEGLSERKFIIDNDIVDFEIFTDSSLTNLLPPRGQGSFSLRFNDNQNELRTNLFIKINYSSRESILKAGEYLFDEMFSLCVDGKKQDSNSIKLNLKINPEFSLELTNPGSTQAISESARFKRLDRGEQVKVDVVVSANIGHSIWLESDNGGYLEHEGLGEKISYKVLLNNSEIGEIGNTKVMIDASSNKTTASGSRVPMTFEVNQDVDNLPAGEYKDVIRVNIQSEM